jgi:4-amino-4-deoxy-L-arabinose transferase-like glycosyltransferase
MFFAKIHLIVLLLASFLIRLSIPFHIYFFSNDYSVVYESYSFDMVRLASNLLSHFNYYLHSEPNTYYVPGYPVFLIPGIMIHHVAFVAIGFQILLSVGTNFLVYALTKIITQSDNDAFWAGLLYAIEPLSIIFSTLIMPETLFTFMITFALFCLFRSIILKSKLYLITAAVSLGLSAYVSPSSLGLLIIIPGILFISKRLTDLPAKKIVLFLIIGSSIVGIWYVRNFAILGNWTFTSGIQELLINETSEIGSASINLPHYTERSKNSLEIYINQIYENPGKWMKLHLKHLLSTLLGSEAHTYLRLLNLIPKSTEIEAALWQGQGLMKYMYSNYRNVPASFILVFGILTSVNLMIYTMAPIGLLKQGIRSYGIVLVITIILYFLIISSGVWGYSRFRHPVMPLLCVLAGIGLSKVQAYFSGQIEGIH